MAWQWKIISSHRKQLVSFAGTERPGQAESIRSILIKQCSSSSENENQCWFLDCGSGGCDQLEIVIDLFLESEFYLQPPEDSPTRRSLFDSLILGLRSCAFRSFHNLLPVSVSVFVDQEEVRGMKVNVVEMLMKISKEKKHDMRRFIVYELLPGLVYGDSNAKFEKFEDAFSIIMSNSWRG